MSELALQLSPRLIYRLLEVDEKLEFGKKIADATRPKINIRSLTTSDVKNLTSWLEKLTFIVKNHWQELNQKEKDSLKGLFTKIEATANYSKSHSEVLKKMSVLGKGVWLEMKVGRKNIDAFTKALGTLEIALLEQIQSEDCTKTLTKDSWLTNNPQALASVRRSLEQASSGEGRYLGSFSKYADLDLDDEPED